MERTTRKLVLAGVASALVLAGGTTAAIAATAGSPGPNLATSATAPAAAAGSVGTVRPPALPGAVVDVQLTDMGAAMHGRSGAGLGGMMGGRGPATMMGDREPGRMMSGRDYGRLMSGRDYGRLMSGRDYGRMMSGRDLQQMTGGTWRGRMMQVRLSRHTVPAGQVSLRVTDSGVMDHELVVLRLANGAKAGARTIGPEGTVDESGSLGEVSNNNGPGAGEGLRPGGTGWTTLDLQPGRYELICNLPGHYAAGMFAELDVTA